MTENKIDKAKTIPDRVRTTLFMLMSVDGKISSGVGDILDPDQDWKRIGGVREGLQSYYDIEQTTDLYNLNTGRVMEKTGVNGRTDIPGKTPVTFFIVDRKPHLNISGVRYLSHKAKKLYVITNNKNHPAFEIKDAEANVDVIFYEGEVDLWDLFRRLRAEFGVEHLTIQSGGTFNTILLRLALIDRVSLVVAPLLVGGKDTPSLFDGESIVEQSQLSMLKALKLVSCETLKNSYIRLEYEVISQTAVME